MAKRNGTDNTLVHIVTSQDLGQPDHELAPDPAQAVRDLVDACAVSDAADAAYLDGAMSELTHVKVGQSANTEYTSWTDAVGAHHQVETVVR
jgi:hypothetical protein